MHSPLTKLNVADESHQYGRRRELEDSGIGRCKPLAEIEALLLRIDYPSLRNA